MSNELSRHAVLRTYSESRNAKIAKARTTHGMIDTPTYSSWESMKERCSRAAHKSYKYYGGRGITVCERWQRFENFLEDMGPRPTGTTLDRKDGTSGYTPDNCLWSTRIVQNTNRRTVKFLTHNGETLSVSEWGRRLGIWPASMHRRVLNWPESRWFEEKKQCR